MKLYKIFDSATGLYSGGGVDPKWSKIGKTWSIRGQMISSLKVYCRRKSIPDSWVVHEFEAAKPKRIPAKSLVSTP